MTSSVENLPTSQSALRWVRVSDTNPFEWSTSVPVIQPSQLGENQVLIENHAAALNPVDYKMAEYNFAQTKLPAVTGYDVSGRIVALGKAVKNFQIGDEVFGYLNLNSSNGGGALQQYSVGDIDGLVKKPSNISHEDAATLGVAFLSAMDGLRQVTIDSSTTIFIPGGSGGVGHFSVQIARIRGAKQVITSASKDDGIKILHEQYQIKDVINHAKENVVDRVRELTEGNGVDIVYDSTYLPSSFNKSIQTLKQGGTWIVLGEFAREGSQEAKNLAEKKAKIIHADISHYWLTSDWTDLRNFAQSSLIQGAKWIEEGKLKPYISQVIQLQQTENVLQQIKQGKAGFGKIVVKLR